MNVNTATTIMGTTTTMDLTEDKKCPCTNTLMWIEHIA
jgi:hypothetical protein